MVLMFSMKVFNFKFDYKPMEEEGENVELISDISLMISTQVLYSIF